jgi:anti-sigma B factor antagonist
MQPYQMLRRISADQVEDNLVIRVITSHLLDEQAEETRRELAAVIKEYRPRGVVLDLGQVTMISSMGVGIIISLIKRVREHGGELTLVHLSSIVEQVFKLCSLISGEEGEGVFDVHPNTETALAALRKKR